MSDLAVSVVRFFDKLRDFPPLIFRLTLAQGFFFAALNKYRDPAGCANYFAALGIPFASLMAWLVILLEGLGSVSLLLGMGTRLIAMPLFVIMLVAIFVAHLPHGQDCAIPVWYALVLFSLMVTGAGRFSVDHYTCRGEKSLRNR